MRRSLALAGGLLLAATAPAAAQTVEQFYETHPMTLIVGFATGGAYDPYARTVARHLPDHLPGAPAIIVKNMQGAGSVLAANHLYNQSPKDGSEIGLIAGSTPLEPLYAAVPTQFEGQKFTWLGSANNEVGVCFSWATSPIATARDLWDKEMITGASGTSNLEFPLALNTVLGTRMKLVRGYKGTSAIMMAMEQGEVQGFCGMVYAAVQAEHPDWLSQHKVRVLLQIGLQPFPQLGDVPAAISFAKSEDDRQVLRLLVGWTIMGRPFLAPPGIPEDRKQALRRAFDETMTDPGFLADAARQRLDINPIGGAAIEDFLRDVYATPRPLIARAGEILAPSR